MGIFADRMAELDVQLSSPDGNIYARLLTGDQFGVWFADGAYDHYTETGLEQQLGSLARAILVARRRAKLAALGEALRRSVRPGGNLPESPRGRRFREEQAELVGIGRAGGIDVAASPGDFWSIRIEPGTLARLDEPQFLTALHSAVLEAMVGMRRVVGAVAGWEGRGAGMVAQVAGTGELGYSGDGGPATEARLAEPGRLAVGSDGTVYVADRLNSRVRSIGVDGIIETIAGTGEQSPPPGTTPGPAPGDGHAATEVPLRPSIAGLAAGPDGSVYICDGTSHRVYRVNPLGAITTFAGTGEPAYAGDGTLAIDAALAEPVDVAVGPDGSGYIADHGNNRIRKVDPGGTITTVAEIDRPVAVEVAPNGVVYAVASGRIWRIGPSGAPAPLDLAAISPTDIAVGPDGLLYASTGAEVFSIHEDGTTELVGGTEAEAGRPVVDGIAFDAAGNLYLSHMVANQVTVVVRATDQPDGFPWHWLVLAVVAVVAVAAVALSLRPARRGVARA